MMIQKLLLTPLIYFIQHRIDKYLGKDKAQQMKLAAMSREDDGFENITVLDISALALEKAKKRLGEKAQKINWIVGDITEFQTDTIFDIWHDRATFHFLTTSKEITKYLNIARNNVSGFLTIGTFSENGPAKCSGLTIKQYSEENLTNELKDGFYKIKCVSEDHLTPLETTQNFLLKMIHF